MTAFSFNLLHGCASALFFLLLHIAVWRARKEKGVFLLWTVAAMAYACTALGAFFLATDIPPLWGSLFFFAFAVLAYTRFYITLTRTLTLRFLEELLQSPSHSLTDQDWERIYSARHAFVIRLPMLTQHGWCTLENGRYRPTAKGKLVGRTVLLARRLYGIRNAG